MTGPFREKSLERLSSPEGLDELLRVVDRKTWVPLTALTVLVAVLLAWAIFGQIPVTVEGNGILVRPREVVEFQAPASGYLVELHVHVGDTVEPGAVLARIAQPELENMLELQRQKARQLSELSTALDDLRPDGEGSAANASGGERIRSLRALADQLKVKSHQAIRQDRLLHEETLRIARALCTSRSAELDAQRQLHKDGIISRQAVLEAEDSYVESLARASILEAELRDLRTDELVIEEQYLNRLDRITDREQQIAEVRREIDRLEHRLEQEGRIVSEQGGRVLEVSATVGEFLTAGARVGSMALREPASPLRALTYFTVRDGKRLSAGMPILVTPDTVERERFGSIRGTISSVSPYPVSVEETENVIGSREIAEALIRSGYRIQVFADLEVDDASFNGYRWSSSTGPEVTITSGTTASGRVAVERRAPITFVLPYLKTATGID